MCIELFFNVNQRVFLDLFKYWTFLELLLTVHFFDFIFIKLLQLWPLGFKSRRQ